MSQGKQIYYNNLRKNVNNMHPRLKELAVEAGAYKDGNNLLTGPMDDAKFAELIVRECIRVPYDMWDKAELNADIAVKIEHRIKEHFGVEE